jgi:hypothetical protein
MAALSDKGANLAEVFITPKKKIECSYALLRWRNGRLRQEIGGVPEADRFMARHPGA